jgi:hypothetical protein
VACRNGGRSSRDPVSGHLVRADFGRFSGRAVSVLLRNGLAVRIIGSASNRGQGLGLCRKGDNNSPLGWVFRDYLNCDQRATTAVQPSFNCARVRAPDEVLICSNPELSQLDNIRIFDKRMAISLQSKRIFRCSKRDKLAARLEHASGSVR